ncbi:hypothetical protein [Dactylosporangium darangshiense]|uniref:Uncharacterized protein n=1 Tax=Dactylosporangium darangshiense TaxID=579108 RepID=A0ABP8DE53_9ACTN
MDLSGFERVTPQRLDEMRVLAARVAAILGEAGLPVCLALETFSSHPDEWGASVGIDVQAPGEVSVTWENPAPLRRRSIDRSGEQDWTHRDVRLNVEAAMAFGAAIADVLHAAGYDTGQGVDFDPAAVWVRPRA